MALFAKAIEVDPTYAHAYAGLSHAYYVIGMLGLEPPGEAYPKAKAAAEKAFELDTTVAEAHNTLAEVKKGYEWDWATAEAEFKRALELNPSYALAHAVMPVFYLTWAATRKRSRRCGERVNLTLSRPAATPQWEGFSIGRAGMTKLSWRVKKPLNSTRLTPAPSGGWLSPMSKRVSLQRQSSNWRRR